MNETPAKDGSYFMYEVDEGSDFGGVIVVNKELSSEELKEYRATIIGSAKDLHGSLEKE